MSTQRFCLALDLVDDPALIAEYQRLHQRIWPEIAHHLRHEGVLDMQIWRLGTRLFMVMETAPAFDSEAKAAADSADPAVIAWEDLMDRYQQRLPWAPADVKWVGAERIFALSEQSS